MPAPTNTTPGTAIVIAALPYSVVQQADDAGVTYDLWYQYTAQSGDNEIGVWAFGDLVTYRPVTTTFSPDGFTLYLNGAGGNNVPFQIPVTVGQTYWFRIRPNAGNPAPAILTLDLLQHAAVPVPIGSIAINDDTEGFPLALLDVAADNTVLAFVPGIAAGEGGNTLPTGEVLLENISASNRLTLYDTAANYAVIATISTAETDVVSTNKLDTFYLGRTTTGVTNATVRTVDALGTLGPTTWTLTGTIGLAGLAPSFDESFLYYVRGGGSNLPIKRWDLVGNVAMTDLVAGVGVGWAIQKDLICLNDDSVIVLVRSTGTTTQECRRYSSTGVLLNTYPLTYALSSTGGDRLASGVDDTTFWVQQKGNPTRQATISQIRVSDGAVLVTRTNRYYEVGAYQGVATATPDARFGPSFSCPFWITRVLAVPPPPGSITVIKTTSPGGLPDLFDFTAGGGLSPGSFQLADGGSQLYDPVAIGSGYSIVETAAPGFSTLVSVSNGSPNTNISVGSAEAVVVTVTNAQQAQPGGDGCPLGVPDPVTGENGCTIPNDF